MTLLFEFYMLGLKTPIEVVASDYTHRETALIRLFRQIQVGLSGQFHHL